MIETLNDTLENAEKELAAARHEEARVQNEYRMMTIDLIRAKEYHRMMPATVTTAHCHVLEAEARVRAAGGKT